MRQMTAVGRALMSNPQRRKVIKLMGAAGAGAIASPWMLQPTARNTCRRLDDASPEALRRVSWLVQELLETHGRREQPCTCSFASI
jgi:hypothetical protein